MLLSNHSEQPERIRDISRLIYRFVSDFVEYLNYFMVDLYWVIRFETRLKPAVVLLYIFHCGSKNVIYSM